MLKNLLESLEDYCSNENIELNSIISDCADHFQIEKGELRQELRRRKFNGLSGKNRAGATTRHYYQWVVILVEFYKIPLDYFHLDDNPELKVKLGSKHNGKAEFFQLRSFSNDGEVQIFMTKKYFKKSKEFLSRIKNSLFVYDYLDRFDGELEKYKVAYVEAHREIFERILKILKKSAKENIPKINYSRILALPNRRINEG